MSQKAKHLRGFSFNDKNHIDWLQSYLNKKLTSDLFAYGFLLPNFSNQISSNDDLNKLVSELKKSAGGRELWRQLYGAWEKKKKRSKNKSKVKLLNFELSIEVKNQLNTLSKNSTIKKTLENLISAAYHEEQKIRKKKTQESIDKFAEIEVAKMKKELDDAKREINELKEKLNKKSIFETPTSELKF
ncbi:hypothetical protein ACUSRQ_003014 [Vibrio harveyi]